VSIRPESLSSIRSPHGQITVSTSRPQRARHLLGSLGTAGYEVQIVEDIDNVLNESARGPDAVVLDVTETDRHAVTALDSLGEQLGVAVVVFTASPDRANGITGLEAGADELLTATMPSEELVARIRAVLRRRSGALPPQRSMVLAGGPVRIDPGRRRVEIRGQGVVLTALEFKLLSYFLLHPDQPITRERLLEAVWGYSVGGTATVTVHVRRLREKIEEDPAQPMLIRTVWGVGYRFTPAPDRKA